jgi:hypothetical protein
MAKSNSTAAAQKSLAPPPFRLPYPFEDIRFDWDASDRYVKLQYTGSIARLIECGAIEPHMVDTAKGQKFRVDSAGHHFQREKRIILHEPVTAGLRVTRHLSDPKFAETLPGVPRGLRFKRLDWLDAHPNELHRHVEEEVDRGYRYRNECLAGTAANLISLAGYSEKYFAGKLSQRTGFRTLLGPTVLGNDGDYSWLSRLMRGYFEIRGLGKTSVVPQPPAPPRPSHLRLVIDNA